jgi:hypothetical protein
LAATFCVLGIVLEYLQGMTDYRRGQFGRQLLRIADQLFPPHGIETTGCVLV